ncbi:hypothetical protein [Paenibacillus phocaensis]|uniref:hypothetical protein n=1 Tax=Paenibacillus phocaensis TaxID=1776378 RepID=UPI000839C946|nr:hypothetical protein [Paenibacillus phocaensis]
MELKDLSPGQLVRITPPHPHAGRSGRVLEVGTFKLLSGGKLIGAKVDIREAGLLIVSPEHLERVEPDPISPGWAEIDI